MVSKNSKEIIDFVEMIVDARDSGLRIFNRWTEKDPALLRKSDPEFYQLLRSLSEKEIALINGVVPMILKTSFYSLFETLELGKDGFEYELTMRSVGTEDRFSLISSAEDNELRNEIDVR